MRARGAAVLLLACTTVSAQRAADAARGEALYARCEACHSLAVDRVGPHHCALFGRKAGSVPGFAYSTAMQRADVVWNRESLDRFLANPLAMVPGTAMTYDGMADAGERADLIAYLQRANAGPPCRAPVSR